jgi:hypothetical protein
MFINVVYPSGITSPRAYFNIDWITLGVMFVVAVVGAIYLLFGHPQRLVSRHTHEELDASGAERPPEDTGARKERV